MSVAKKGDRKTGKWLERIIQVIELQANNKEGVTVERRKRLRDKDTGRPREHDVVITYSAGHHAPMLVALECRDRSRPVAVEAVEAFHTKCLRTGVHQGVIVSATGFAKTTLTKASSLGIRCLELQDAERFDWCAMPGVRRVEKVLLGVQVGAMFDGDPVEPWTLFENGTLKIGDEETKRMGLNVMKTIKVDPIIDSGKWRPGVAFVRRFIDTQTNFVAVDAKGQTFKLKALTLKVAFTIRETLIPIHFHRYVDAASGGELSHAATAELDYGTHKMTLTIAGPEDGPKYMTLTPSDDRAKK